eukprot:1466888-Rhodomonas_salina.3
MSRGISRVKLGRRCRFESTLETPKCTRIETHTIRTRAGGVHTSTASMLVDGSGAVGSGITTSAFDMR